MNQYNWVTSRGLVRILQVQEWRSRQWWARIWDRIAK